MTDDPTVWLLLSFPRDGEELEHWTDFTGLTRAEAREMLGLRPGHHLGDSYPVTAEVARRLEPLVGQQIDTSAFDYFLERSDMISGRMRELRREKKMPPDDDDGWLDSLPALVRAAARGEIDEVRRLLAAGADPTEADDMGWSALHAAAVRDHLDVVELLLQSGAEVDLHGSDGFTPLINAAGAASEEVIEALLVAGADVNACDPRFQWTPLSRAAEHGNAPVVRMLLRAGARVEGAGDTTPLMDAAEAGSIECVDLLLEAGADPAREVDGESAAALARKHGHTDVAERLEAAAQRPASP